MKAVPTIEVDEYGVISVLKALNVPVIGKQYNGGRVVFVFDNSGECASKALAEHLTGKLALPTRDLLSSLQAVKAEIFDTKRGGSSR